MKATFLHLCCTLALLASTGHIYHTKPSLYQYNYENVLGTSFQLKVSAQSETIADQAEQCALAEIDRLAAILSTYDPNSEISRWQNTLNTDIAISPELFEVFQLFDHWKQKTSGALTASIATASNLWKDAEQKQQLPSQTALEFAVKNMERSQWTLNPVAKTARHISAEPLVLNSFVKSYIIHKVSTKIMNIPGVAAAVTNIGGDIVVAGSVNEKVSISHPVTDAENAHPVSLVNLYQKAIATSGNYRRGYQIDDRWYSHIIDPRTAKPAAGISSATVIAPDATDAGALATAFNILHPNESIKLAKQFPGIEYQIITTNGEIYTSPKWKELEIKSTPFSPVKPFTYQQKRKLNITLELPQFEGRFRRPFVAVWIENQDRELVKSISLWYNKPRWLPDLKRWYAKHQSVMQDVGAVGSISSATRSAGQYKLEWDGLDNNGKSAPAGTYVLYIEAAREHGTYQLIQQEFEWNGKVKQISLEGGVEIKSASIEITK
jgi:thiamine biosynthesis lipoprotein ApbE